MHVISQCSSILRYLIDSRKKGQLVNSVAFGDPALLFMQTIAYESTDRVVDYIVRLLLEYSEVDSVLLPFNTG